MLCLTISDDEGLVLMLPDGRMVRMRFEPRRTCTRKSKVVIEAPDDVSVYRGDTSKGQMPSPQVGRGGRRPPAFKPGEQRPLLQDQEPRRLTDDELGGRAALEAAGLEPVDGWDDERPAAAEARP